MTIDGRGNIYVNSIGFDFAEMSDRVSDPSKPPTGVIALITPDGTAAGGRRRDRLPERHGRHTRQRHADVSESFTGTLLAFDIADDGSLSGRRTWAEGIGPDGICLDAEGAIWTSSHDNECVRVAEGGHILDRIQLDRACFATMLGGNRPPDPVHDGESVPWSVQVRSDARRTNWPGVDRRGTCPWGWLALTKASRILVAEQKPEPPVVP